MSDRLGELLICSCGIGEQDVEGALVLQRQIGGRIGEILINQGVCSEEDVFATLSKQLNLPRLKDWGELPTDPYAFELYGMERSWWLKQRAVPLGEKNAHLWVAVEDVLDGFVAETVNLCAGKVVLPVIAGSHELRQLLSVFELNESALPSGDESLLMDLASGAPIIQFVNDTIQRAIDAHASDIHFESYRGVFRVRFRVDGVLHEADRPGVGMQAAVISRLKLMASLDISEKQAVADRLEEELVLQNEVRSALTYPAFLLVISVVVILFLFLVVIPKFGAIAGDMGDGSSGSLQALIFISAVLRDYFWLWGGGACSCLSVVATFISNWEITRKGVGIPTVFSCNKAFV